MSELLLHRPKDDHEDLWLNTPSYNLGCKSAAIVKNISNKLNPTIPVTSSTLCWDNKLKYDEHDENEDSGFGDLDLPTPSPPTEFDTNSTTRYYDIDSSIADDENLWRDRLLCELLNPPTDHEYRNDNQDSILFIDDKKCDVIAPDEQYEKEDDRNKPKNIKDAVDPEESVQSMISNDDFCKFVLFKSHYKRFTNLWQLYNDALEASCYVEDKYDDLQKEFAKQSCVKETLESRLADKELELAGRDDELFDVMERLARLEDEGEVLKKEKHKIQRESEKLESEKVTCENQIAAIQIERDHYASNCNTLKKMVKTTQYDYDTIRRKSQYTEQEALSAKEKIEELEYSMNQMYLASQWLRRGLQHLSSCSQRRCKVCASLKNNFTIFQDRNQSMLSRTLSTIREDVSKLRLWLRPMPMMDVPDTFNSSCPEDAPSPYRRQSVRRASLSLAVTLNPCDLGDDEVQPPTAETSLISPLATSSPSPFPLPTPIVQQSNESGYFSYECDNSTPIRPNYSRRNGRHYEEDDEDEVTTSCLGGNNKFSRRFKLEKHKSNKSLEDSKKYVSKGTNTLEREKVLIPETHLCRPIPATFDEWSECSSNTSANNSEEGQTKFTRQNTWRSSVRKLFSKNSKR